MAPLQNMAGCMLSLRGNAFLSVNKECVVHKSGDGCFNIIKNTIGNSMCMEGPEIDVVKNFIQIWEGCYDGAGVYTRVALFLFVCKWACFCGGDRGAMMS